MEKESASKRVSFDLCREVRELLGGSRVLKKKKTSARGLIPDIRAGLPAESLASLTRKTRLDEADVLGLVGVSSRTLARRRERLKPLSAAQSDRLYRVAHIVARATEALGAREAAVRWLQTPSGALFGERPLRILDTQIGFREAEDVLGRLEHGVYT